MSKESTIIVLGTLTALTSFLGIPSGWKEMIFLGVGVLLVIVGIFLRRDAFLRSIENGSGEREADAFSESPIVPTGELGELAVDERKEPVA